jgi:hypothetical protein
VTFDAPASLTRIARISDDAVFRELGDEAVVLNLATGTYFGLNAVALRVWQLIEEVGLLRDVRDAVVREFEVDPDTATRDLSNLIEQLSTRGLVDVS